MTAHTVINPPELGEPRGFAHGVLMSSTARRLVVAGQTATDTAGQITGRHFAAQFEVALARVLTVVRAGGGNPEHIVRMTVYVTDMVAYRNSRTPLREVWARLMGTHFPAMALVQVVSLVDEGALVEIEAEAALP